MKPVGMQRLILDVAYDLALKSVRKTIGKGQLHLHSPAAINRMARSQTSLFISVARVKLRIDAPEEPKAPGGMSFNAAVAALRIAKERVVIVKPKPKHGKW